MDWLEAALNEKKASREEIALARLLVEKTFLQMAGQSERPEDFTA